MSISTFRKACIAPYLGTVPYEVALKLQRGLMQASAEGKIGDVLLLLQHPSVFTVGRFRGGEDLIVPPETLVREGIAVFHTNRGGGITYHGPGQLVGYPVLNLKETGLGVREYIWKLESAVIKLLLALGIRGYRLAGYPGVWVGEKKVCSIGIHISHYITTHGFALNVTNDLRYFKYLRPCGLAGEVMTSVSELLGHRVGMKTIIEELLPSFSEIFGLTCQQEDGEWLAILDAQSG
ncbi:MAG: lipoyl(octanoyl) transferase LipB [Dehalococcoidia bacterium]